MRKSAVTINKVKIHIFGADNRVKGLRMASYLT